MNIQLVLVNRWNEFLLHQTHEGTWKLVGGETKVDEKPELAAVRIAQEEIGYEMSFFTPLREGVYLGTLHTELDELQRNCGELRLFNADELHTFAVEAPAIEQLNPLVAVHRFVNDAPNAVTA